MRYWIATLLLLTIGLHNGIAQNRALHVVILGDSNTWLGGDDCSKPRGWNKWFNDAMEPASIRSYARSGATWTHTPATTRNTQENIGVLGDNNVISNQVHRLVEASENGRQTTPDLILIMAGTNDVWFNDKRPHALEATGDATTLTGAVKLNVELLREAFPQSQIILMTPMQTTAAPVDSIAKAGDLIEAEGLNQGCSVIRMDSDNCINSERERQKRQYTSDGTHTNTAGARLIGFFVAEKVKAVVRGER